MDLMLDERNLCTHPATHSFTITTGIAVPGQGTESSQLVTSFRYDNTGWILARSFVQRTPDEDFRIIINNLIINMIFEIARTNISSPEVIHVLHLARCQVG